MSRVDYVVGRREQVGASGRVRRGPARAGRRLGSTTSWAGASRVGSRREYVMGQGDYLVGRREEPVSQVDYLVGQRG